MSALPARRTETVRPSALLVFSPLDVAALRRGLEASKPIDIRLGTTPRHPDSQRILDWRADVSDVTN